MRIFQKAALPFLCLTLLISLAACEGHYRPKDTYVSYSGARKTLQSDKQSCVASCNAEYDRCGEGAATSHDPSHGRLNSVIGAQADCRSLLRTCLNGCKGR